MELARSSRAVLQAQPQGRAMLVHADPEWLAPLLQGDFEFFSKLETRLELEGIKCFAVKAGGRLAQQLLSKDHLHIVLGDAPGYRPGLFHATPSYVWGFWYFDELGVKRHSSLHYAHFCAEEVDFTRAEYFFNGVTGYMLRENVSGSPQEVRVHTPMRGAKAVVFCQDIEDQPDRAHYLTTSEMIRTTAEYDRDALVYVKLHPKQQKRHRIETMSVCQDYPNVKISEASVHDLIEASDYVVTQNSGTGFEALMQKCPVITCAKSDYWHAALTARSIADLHEALTYGAEALVDFPYEKYLYWFLGRQCLEPAKADFTRRAWARLREKAFL